MRRCLRNVPQVSTCQTPTLHILNPVGNIRKKLVVKVFAGPVWEQRLLKFVGVFTEKRKAFVLALTLHTVAAVDAVVLKLDAVDERTVAINQKYDVLLCVGGDVDTLDQDRGNAAAVQRVHQLSTEGTRHESGGDGW